MAEGTIEIFDEHGHDIIMRAFILRRVGLIRHEQGGVVLIGPGCGGDTFRLEQFMTRNGYPHRLLHTG